MEESFGLVLGWKCRPNLAQIRGFFLSCYLTPFRLPQEMKIINGSADRIPLKRQISVLKRLKKRAEALSASQVFSISRQSEKLGEKNRGIEV